MTTPPNRATRILVVDDDLEFRRLVMTWLVRRGFDVTLAHDGVSAIATARKSPPDVVLLDLHIPAGDGFTMLDRMRDLPFLVAVPIVVVSARAAAECRDQAVRLGAAAYLQKPVTADELVSTVARVVRHSTRAPSPELARG